MRDSHLIRHHFLRSLFNKPHNTTGLPLWLKGMRRDLDHTKRNSFLLLFPCFEILSIPFANLFFQLLWLLSAPTCLIGFRGICKNRFVDIRKLLTPFIFAHFPIKFFLEYFQYFCSLLRNGALTPSYQAGYKLLILIMEEVDMCACDHFFAHV